MTGAEIAARCRCCACAGPVERANLVMLERRATWKYPTHGNVLIGSNGGAMAVVCDRCADGGRLPTEAVEFVNGDDGGPDDVTIVVYHPLTDLEEMR